MKVKRAFWEDNVQAYKEQMQNMITIYIDLHIIMEENSKALTFPSEFNPNDVFRVELSAEEMQALTAILPKGYSFHVDHRKKDSKPPVKKKNPDQLLLASATQTNFRPKSIPPSQPVPTAAKKPMPRPELMNQQVKPCLKILQQLQQHKCALPFMQPVDVQGLNIPEYREIVKEPMDLTTIENKLKTGRYQTPAHFHADVVKIFNNSYLFNAPNEDFIKITNQFEKYYYRISGEIKPQQEKPLIKPQPILNKSQKKKKKPTMTRQLNESQPMTLEEKKELAYNIHRLAKEHIKGLRNIIFDNSSDANEFDLEQLSQKKLREAQKYIRTKMTQMESSLRSNLAEKTQQQNLDELESEITEEFIDQPLEPIKEE